MSSAAGEELWAPSGHIPLALESPLLLGWGSLQKPEALLPSYKPLPNVELATNLKGVLCRERVVDYSEESNMIVDRFEWVQTVEPLYSLSKSNSPCSVESTAFDIMERRTESGTTVKRNGSLTAREGGNHRLCQKTRGWF